MMLPFLLNEGNNWKYVFIGSEMSLLSQYISDQKRDLIVVHIKVEPLVLLGIFIHKYKIYLMHFISALTIDSAKYCASMKYHPSILFDPSDSIPRQGLLFEGCSYLMCNKVLLQNLQFMVIEHIKASALNHIPAIAPCLTGWIVVTWIYKLATNMI